MLLAYALNIRFTEIVQSDVITKNIGKHIVVILGVEGSAHPGRHLVDETKDTVIVAIAMPVVLRNNAQRHGTLPINGEFTNVSSYVLDPEFQPIVGRIEFQIQEVPDILLVKFNDGITGYNPGLLSQATRFHTLDLKRHQRIPTGIFR
jgi:hypothetical protein